MNRVTTYVRGWVNYFGLSDTPSVFDEFDKWLHRRLRQVRWKKWKRQRTKIRMLRALGMTRRDAVRWGLTRKGSWRIAGSAPLQRGLPTAYWRALGLVGFTESYRCARESLRTAGCGPACPVV